MMEYFALGHAEIIYKEELNNPDSYYLPVHTVSKPSSTTTKLRAVFDASAKTTNGVVLNDILLPGPNLYPVLLDALIRFRKYAIGISADISKMFREILLHPSERDLHRFVVKMENDELVDCRMKRLTFGVTSSPFLATKVLYCSSHPNAARAIEKDFYVDDFLAGADTVEEAWALHVELCDLLSKAGMTLRKWRTNSKYMRLKIPKELSETSPLTLTTPKQAPKALGIHWDVVSDSLLENIIFT